jgi:antitoxin VapB
MKKDAKKKAKRKKPTKPALPDAVISKPNQKKLRIELDAILRRVDRLPVLDSRTPDEIIGYDEHGIPTPGVAPPGSAVSGRKPEGPMENPDLDDWWKKYQRKVPPAVKEFLKYRHREWELGIGADIEGKPKVRRARTRRPAP